MVFVPVNAPLTLEPNYWYNLEPAAMRRSQIRAKLRHHLDGVGPSCEGKDNIVGCHLGFDNGCWRRGLWRIDRDYAVKAMDVAYIIKGGGIICGWNRERDIPVGDGLRGWHPCTWRKLRGWCRYQPDANEMVFILKIIGRSRIKAEIKTVINIVQLALAGQNLGR